MLPIGIGRTLRMRNFWSQNSKLISAPRTHMSESTVLTWFFHFPASCSWATFAAVAVAAVAVAAVAAAVMWYEKYRKMLQLFHYINLMAAKQKVCSSPTLAANRARRGLNGARRSFGGVERPTALNYIWFVGSSLMS